MPITIGSNIASLQAQRALAKADETQRTSFERLSSGLRINRGSDDAAGLAVASTLNADTRIFGQAIRNVNDGINLLNTAEGAFDSLTNVAVRQRELAEQAANGTYSLTQRKALQTESDALTDEFNRILASTSFNGISIFSNSTLAVSLQAGSGANAVVSETIGSDLSRAVGTGRVTNVSSVTVGGTISQTIAGDFNGDGKSDIVAVAGAFGSGTTVSFLRGLGDGTFASHRRPAGPRCADRDTRQPRVRVWRSNCPDVGWSD